MNEWISIDDQDPPYDRVIVVARKGWTEAMLGYRRSFRARNRNAREWIINGFPTNSAYVTHWMELPPLPEGK